MLGVQTRGVQRVLFGPHLARRWSLGGDEDVAQRGAPHVLCVPAHVDRERPVGGGGSTLPYALSMALLV